MIRDGWFREESSLWEGQAFALKVNKVLHEGKTMFQDVLVFESESYGNVLVLDGVIQVAERDEFAYQEMISHIPLMAHPNPKKVLVVGGGDGGCVREVLKHPGVEEVHLVEIDQSVIDLSIKYLPNMASCLTGKDPRVHVHICDGFKYLEEQKNQYDVIISDTSDPEGPAEVLFQKEYFQLLSNALTDQGVASLQASENVWLKIEKLQQLQQTCKSVFPVVNYATTCVPTYTSGQLGLMVCGKSPDAQLREPRRKWEGAPDANKYYSAKIHAVSFVLPTFALKYIDNE